MIDKEIDNILTPQYFGSITIGKIEFAFSEGYNFEVIEVLQDGSARGILCNMESDLAHLEGKEIIAKANTFQNIIL